jgi:quinol monooxygenase YgiN
MAEETRKDGGTLIYEVLQQPNRLNHFTVAEIWKDRNALDAHQMAAHTRQFREKLAPMAGALYDERFYKSVN